MVLIRLLDTPACSAIRFVDAPEAVPGEWLSLKDGRADGGGESTVMGDCGPGELVGHFGVSPLSVVGGGAIFRLCRLADGGHDADGAGGSGDVVDANRPRLGLCC